MTETLRFEVVDDVAHIELNRPAARHALNLQAVRELADVAGRCEQQPDVRAVLISAQGPYFSVGGDLAEFQAQGDRIGEHLREASTWFHIAVTRLARLPAPVVAAVGGVVAGGGLSLVCGADLVISAASARFTFAYSRSGLPPDGGATWFLPRLVGRRRAYELLVLNPVLSAAEAQHLGLVNRVVPDRDLEDEAWALARELANGAPGAQAAIKELLLRSAGNGLEEQLDLESRTIARLGSGPEAREGLSAFLAKRRPDYRATSANLPLSDQGV